jgi:hypothetical protein
VVDLSWQKRTSELEYRSIKAMQLADEKEEWGKINKAFVKHERTLITLKYAQEKYHKEKTQRKEQKILESNS